MIHPTEVEYEIVDVIDMQGTIIVQARDVNTDTAVSLNFNSISFHQMSQDDVSHHIVTALRREIEHNNSKTLPQAIGKSDNLTHFKKLMLTRERVKLTPLEKAVTPAKIVDK